MKVVILAGGFGTRISEESYLKPKPMIEIGGKPILWHIMKIYSHYGYNDFIICCGYKQQIIKEFFANYYLYTSDITFDMVNNDVEIHRAKAEPWRVTVVDTGYQTMTGGRIKQIQRYVGDEPFMLTYGDGVADVDISALVRFHKSHGKIMTVTSVNVGQNFGVMDIDEAGMVTAFREKNHFADGSVINGGYMVCEPKIFQYIEGDMTVFEQEPMEHVAKEHQLMAYKHNGFWKCMDTQRDMRALEKMWQDGTAPWKVWKD